MPSPCRPRHRPRRPPPRRWRPAHLRRRPHEHAADRGGSHGDGAGIDCPVPAAGRRRVVLGRPRQALPGLALLGRFGVPLTPDARSGAVGGTVVFCAGVVGSLGLLSADGRHRLRLWGRLVHPWHDEDNEGPDIRPLTAAGRRIGSAAVVLALSLPLLVPGLRQHRLFPGTGGGGSGGYHGQISFPKPLDALNSELHETHPTTILTYRTTDVQ